MEEQPTDLAALLPGHCRADARPAEQSVSGGGTGHSGGAREQDAVLDSKAAVLEQSFYRLLRMVNGISATEYLSEKSTLSLPGTRTSCS